MFCRFGKMDVTIFVYVCSTSSETDQLLLLIGWRGIIKRASRYVYARHILLVGCGPVASVVTLGHTVQISSVPARTVPLFGGSSLPLRSIASPPKVAASAPVRRKFRAHRHVHAHCYYRNRASDGQRETWAWARAPARNGWEVNSSWFCRWS